MPEPVTLGAGALIWEYAVKPVAKSIEKEYGEETKKLLKTGIGKVFDKLPFKRNELEVIEAEIVDADIEVLTDEKKFLAFIQNNIQIKKELEILQKIHTDKIVLNSFKEISNSTIKVPGAKKNIEDSFENIKDSQINI